MEKHFESFKRWSQLLLAVIVLLVIAIYTSEQFKLHLSTPKSVQSNVNSTLLGDFMVNSSRKGFHDETQQQQLTFDRRKNEAEEERRKPRQAQDSPLQTSTANKSKSYYEEQMPVVVHAESEPRVLMAYRQPPSPPPQDELYAEDAGIAGAIDYYDGPPDVDSYPEGGPSPAYYDPVAYAVEGRSNPEAARYGGQSYNNANRKIQQRPGAGGNNRDSYNVYEDVSDYDYPHPSQRQQQHNQQQFMATTTSRPTESTLLSIVKHLRNMWELYRAFATAWNVVAERSQRKKDEEGAEVALQQEEEKLKQKQVQKQLKKRINSRKPKPNNTASNLAQNRRNSTEKSTTMRATKTPATTAPTTTKTSATKVATSSQVEPRLRAASAVGGRKGDVGQQQKYTKSDRGKRRTSEEKRNADMDAESAATTTEAEGRYIKGDPLKGYYDFVITEGSYKFWAAFQVGTAILVIYSTFAAIYYSKVNPLVSDYDYTDYLGGARALADGDQQDFVDDDDDDDDDGGEKRAATRWSEWIPRMGHSVKFILDAIDKLPVDQE